ncbi:MAG: methionine ABC transporter permease, partial [Burkholderiaceae bacterium]
MSSELLAMLADSFVETLVMVAVSGGIGAALGIPLGIALHLTTPQGILPQPLFNRVLGVTINAVRSVPFIILLVAVIPFTRLLAGSSIGTAAAIVPLTIAAAPFIARLVETALREVDHGLVEAAQAMGATHAQIVTKVLLPEALPGIVAGLTISLVSLVGYSAMAGAIGGGGLGDLGIRYGYQ